MNSSARSPFALLELHATLERALTRLAGEDVTELVSAASQDDPYVSVAAAAQLLDGPAQESVREWAAAGRFPRARQGADGKWQFSLYELLALVHNREIVMDRKRRGDYATPFTEGDPFAND